jgi:hypothetical protein
MRIPPAHYTYKNILSYISSYYLFHPNMSLPITIPFQPSSLTISRLNEFAAREHTELVDRPLGSSHLGFVHSVVCLGIAGYGTHSSTAREAKSRAYADWWSAYQARLNNVCGVTIDVSLVERYGTTAVIDILSSVYPQDGGYDAACQRIRNALMHALTGNQDSERFFELSMEAAEFIEVTLKRLQDEAYAKSVWFEVPEVVILTDLKPPAKYMAAPKPEVNYPPEGYDAYVFGDNGAEEAAAAAHNAEMHASNGNSASANFSDISQTALRRSLKYIKNKEKLFKLKGWSFESKNCAIALFDPFHDTKIEAPRFPDGQTDRSVAMCEPGSFSISAPPNIGTGLWDLIVVISPYQYGTTPVPTIDGVVTTTYFNKLVSTKASSASNGTDTISAGGAPNWANGTGYTMPCGICWFAVPTGTSIQQVNNVSGDPITSCGFAQVSPNWLRGAHRILGGAFELVNTTAPIYMQGTCTVARSTAHRSFEAAGEVMNYLRTDSSTFTTYTYGQLTFQTPTGTIASGLNDMVEQQDSRQWPAARGAYVVQRMRDVPQVVTPRRVLIRLTSPGQSGVAFDGPAPVWAIGGGTFVYCGSTDNSTGTGTNQVCQVPPLTEINSDWSVCRMTGLSPATTFTLRTRQFVERFPTSGTSTSIYNEDDMVALARIPPARNDAMIRMYLAGMSKLPPGCPYDENPLGEWFDTVMDIISSVAPAVGDAFGPKGSAIGRSVAIAASTAKNANEHARKAEQTAKQALANTTKRVNKEAFKGKGKNTKKK